jgi:molecular chaperone Hsp33
MSDQFQVDIARRFSFDDLDARGCYVRLTEVVEDIQNTHHYPPALAKLLNEFAVSAVLLRDSVKLDGSLTIQYRAVSREPNNAVKMIIADCSYEYGVRAVCEFDSDNFKADVDKIDLRELNKTATLTITISPKEGRQYQGVVAIEAPTLAACLQDYFLRSEQLPSQFEILADENQVVGMSVHAMPEQDSEIVATLKDDWNRLTILLDTLTDDEFRELDEQSLLTRLFHEENCRLHEVKQVQFSCDCSRERSEGAIRSLGKSEVESLIAEQETITIDCHFCFQKYEFNQQDMQKILSDIV